MTSRRMISLRSLGVLCARLQAIKVPPSGRVIAGHHAGRLRHPGWQKHWQSSIKRKPQGTVRSAQAPEHSVKKNKKSKSVAEASASNGKNSSVASVSSVVKELKGAAKRPMPTAIHPMLAISIEKPFDNPEYLFEIKWDGYRAVSFIKNSRVRLVSRNQNDLTGQYPELHQLPKFVKAITAILDGEVVAKRRGSCYEERRSREWLKIKITQTLDCVIGGYTDPEGSRQYFGSIVLGLYDKKGNLIHVGQAGTGFSQSTLKQIFSLLKDRETNRNPFHGNVDARKVHWIKPELVAEIKFTEWTHETADGGLKLRAHVFMGLRGAKGPKECTFADQVIGKITT